MRSLKSMISFLDVCHLTSSTPRPVWLFWPIFQDLHDNNNLIMLCFSAFCWEFCNAFDSDNIALTAFLSKDLFSRRFFPLLCCFLMTEKILKKHFPFFKQVWGCFDPQFVVQIYKDDSRKLWRTAIWSMKSLDVLNELHFCFSSVQVGKLIWQVSKSLRCVYDNDCHFIITFSIQTSFTLFLRNNSIEFIRAAFQNSSKKKFENFKL